MYERFEEMMKKLSPTLRRIAHRMNGHFTFFSDDDLYQEALVHLWVIFQKGVLDDKTDSYILQGCYFHLKNYLRTTLDKAKLVSLSESADNQDTALEEMLASKSEEGYDGLNTILLEESAILKNLNEREQKVLRLSMEGLTVREIGARLGVSHVMVVKVKARIKEKCNALKNLPNHGYHN